MALPANQHRESRVSPRIASTVVGAGVASIGATALSSGAHSSALGFAVMAIGLVMVIEALGEATRALRTWGIVLAVVGVAATMGPLADELAGDTVAGPLYLATGATATIVGLALGRA